MINRSLSGGAPSLGLLLPALVAISLFSASSHALEVRFSQSSYIAGEGAGAATITVEIEGCTQPTADPNNFLLVDISHTGGSATNGQDFSGLPVTLDFVNSGQGDWSMSRTFDIAIRDDTSVEGDETVAFAITTVEGGLRCANAQETEPVLAGSPDSAVLTIQDNDTASEPTDVSVSALSIGGNAGDTATGSFQILGGDAPFSVTVANTDRGSVDNPSPNVGDTVTYSFRIPAAATDQQQFTDTITLTSATGEQTLIPVTITARVGSASNPIDDAMESIAQTQPQQATAKVIGTVCPKGVVSERLQQDCNVMVGAALQPDGSTDKTQASTALGQVTSDQASAPLNASQTSIQAQGRNIASRLTALRLGSRGFAARGLNIHMDGESLPAGRVAESLWRDLTHARGGAAGADQAMDLGRLGIFVNGSISLGDKDRTSNVAGFDFETRGITLGADYRFTDQLALGLAAGYSSGDIDLDQDGGKLDSDSYSLSLYGTYYQDSGLYLDGMLTYGSSDHDQRRAIRYDIGSVAVRQDASSSFDGSLWSASFGGGYAMSQGALSFGPTARLEYSSTDLDGYDETMSAPSADGGGWATHIDGQDTESFTFQLGADVSYAVSTSWGVLLPQGSLEWVHEMKDGGSQVSGFFIQDPTRETFALDTDRPDTDYFNLRLGVSAQFAQGTSAFLYWRRLMGYNDLSADSFNAGVRMEF